jgi:peptidoglycan/LPS O-acetylase OafA/YrhL
VKRRNAHPLVGLLAFTIGAAFASVFGRPLSSVGAGLMGGGGAMIFSAWTGPLDRGPRRKLAAIALGGFAVIAMCFTAILLATTRHSTARLLGDIGAGVALVLLVVALALWAREQSQRATSSEL